jgi:hypothetical protein
MVVAMDDNVLSHLREVLQEATAARDACEDTAIKRKLSIFITDLEKLYAYYFTYLMGE